MLMNSLVVQNYYNWQFYISKTQKFKFLTYLNLVNLNYIYLKHYTITFYSTKYFRLISKPILYLLRNFILNFRYKFIYRYKYKNLSLISLNITKSYSYWIVKNFLHLIDKELNLKIFKQKYLKHSIQFDYINSNAVLLFGFNKKYYNTLVLFFYNLSFSNYYSYMSEYTLTYAYFYKWNIFDIFVYNYLYYFKVKHF
uniref:Uncharacterized protein n=1 Tax=Strombidium sp. TaxID=181122 RepID=A0A7T0M4X4_9SPIT|nr:hypothetical protein [Strombidium sp.]